MDEMASGTHETRDSLARLFRGKSTASEIDKVVAHLVGCRDCWAIAARAVSDQQASGEPLCTEGPLKAVVDLLNLEEQQLLEGLEAQAAWLGIRSLGAKARRDKIRTTRALHSHTFVETLLSESRGPVSAKESEELGYLALLAAQQLPETTYPPATKSDLAAECCAVIGNGRRRLA